MTCNPADVCIGPFVVGEIPAPIEYTFLDSDSISINVTGYAARFIYREQFSSTPVTQLASVTDGVNGRVTYTWESADLASPGRYAAEFVIGNGVQRFVSSRITYTIRTSLGPTPSI